MTLKHPFRKVPAKGILRVEGQPTVIFDTVCTKSKMPWLATEEMHKALIEVWSEQATAWLVGRYVVMPDHVHYFAWETESGIEYPNWVSFWKSKFSWQHSHDDLRMQTGSWDVRMRTDSHYEEKWEYVRRNPERAGLIDDSDQWPYQGTDYDLRW